MRGALVPIMDDYICQQFSRIPGHVACRAKNIAIMHVFAIQVNHSEYYLLLYCVLYLVIVAYPSTIKALGPCTNGVAYV